MSAPPASVSSIPGRYLTVGVGGEPDGLKVLKIREIVRIQKITPALLVVDQVIAGGIGVSMVGLNRTSAWSDSNGSARHITSPHARLPGFTT